MLMDIMMPVMDGLSAMAALRRVSNARDPADGEGRGHRQGAGAERRRGRLHHKAVQRGGDAGARALTASGGTCSSAAAWGRVRRAGDRRHLP